MLLKRYSHIYIYCKWCVFIRHDYTSQDVCLLVNISIEANSVDPDQNAPKESTLFVEEASKIFKQIKYSFYILAS